MKLAWWAGILLVVLGLVAYSVLRPSWHSPEGKIKIAMGGRSTMALWFKHWNWPYPLRVFATYRNWPIAYRKYSRGYLYLEYLPLKGPRSRNPAVPFGQEMLESFRAGLDKGDYEAAFFKFCFVDFGLKGEEWQARFHDLTRTVTAAYRITRQKNLKLILGNALPLIKPSPAVLRLQKEYNAWLNRFVASHPQVTVFDFFSRLTDSTGGIKMDLARGKDDPHPNDRAFTLLDQAFFREVSQWLATLPAI